MAINFQTDSKITLEGTLLAVTDTQLWLSAEATNGGATDALIVTWGHGNRERTLDALWYGMGISIGDKVRIRGERNYWPQANSDFDWVVAAKVA